MNDEGFDMLAGLMAKLAYELHDLEGIPKNASETMLEIWREFAWYADQIDK